MSFEASASELRVSVQVKSGGYELDLRETGRSGDHTFVKIRLTAPGAGELVTEALETKALRVPLPKEAGPVHVQLQRLQRGAHYLTTPEFELAKIAPR